MAETAQEKTRLRDFPKTFWLVIFFEFIERGAYYGIFGIMATYWTNYLGFSHQSYGLFSSFLIPFCVYGLPLVTGAIADKMGYKRTLTVAFGLLGTGYFLASQTQDMALLSASLVIMGVGAGTFKPIIGGSIAKLTNEKNSTIGFAVFYWSINLGAFLVPLILVPMLKVYDPVVKAHDISYVFLYASIATAAMIIPTLFIFKEPKREITKKEPLGVTLSEIFGKVWLVIKDWQFILFLFIYSLFWILYFQMYNSVQWFLTDIIDPSEINAFINNLFGAGWFQNLFGAKFQFDVEHITVINAGTIILLQLFISSIVKKTRTMPTLVAGISFGIAGITILAFSSNIWIFMSGLFIFSIGEMVAHPKYIAYLGMIAPQDKKATYMGFSFLYGVFGALIANLLGGFLYPVLVIHPMRNFVHNQLIAAGSKINLFNAAENLKTQEIFDAAKSIGLERQEVTQQAMVTEFWLIFAGIGLISIIGLLAYRKFIGTRKAADLS